MTKHNTYSNLTALLFIVFIANGIGFAEEEPSYRDPELRVGKFSVAFDVSLVEYMGEDIDRVYFRGGDYRQSGIDEEYQFTATGMYQFTQRMSLATSFGYIKTAVKDPLLYTDTNFFGDLNPYSGSIIECRQLSDGVNTWRCNLPPAPNRQEVDKVINFGYLATDEHFKGKIGELQQIPLAATVRFDLMTRTRWRPYVSAGLGYTFSSFKDNNMGAALINEIRENALFTGTQGFCDIVDMSTYVQCTGFRMPDGSLVPGLAFGSDTNEPPWFIQGIPALDRFDWHTQINDSVTWTIQSGFDWTMSKKIDFTFRSAYVWYDEKLRSRINTNIYPNTLVLVYPNPDWYDSTNAVPDADEYLANFDACKGDIVNCLANAMHVIRLTPPTMRLDTWSFGVGFRYTFKR